MARSDFVHLHTHTEYSMLDGAASNEKLFAEVARQGTVSYTHLTLPTILLV